MLWIALYLYVVGATLMWWWARAQEKSKPAKILAVILWPIIVPIAALWA